MVAIKVAPEHESAQYLHLEYLQESENNNNKRQGFEDKFIYKINRALIRMLAMATRLNLDADYGEVQCGDRQANQLMLPECSAFAKVKYISQWLLRRSGGIVTKILALLPYLFTFHLIAALYYQYSYDFDLMRLMKLSETIHQTPLVSAPKELSSLLRNNNTALELELIGRMQETKRGLDFIGAPYRHMSITIEAIYLFLIAVSLITFNAVNLYYRFVAPLELHVIRESLNYEGEQRRLQQLIKTQAKCFAKSERLFARILSQCSDPRLILEPHHYQTFDCERGSRRIVGAHLNMNQLASRQKHSPFSSSSKEYSAPARTIENNNGGRQTGDMTGGYNFSSSQSLAAMLSSGALIPFNRSLDWFDKRSKFALGFNAFCLAYEEVIFVVITVVAILERDADRPTSTSDTLIGVSIIGLVAFISFSSLLFTTYSVIAGLDQVVLISKLLKVVKRCTILNSNEYISLTRGSHYNRLNLKTNADEDDENDEIIETKFETQIKTEPIALVVVDVDDRNASGARTLFRNCQQSSSALPSYRDNHLITSGRKKMNTNLLFILMQYKIFTAQATPVIRSLSPMVMVFSILLLLIPIIVRFHLPYLNMFRDIDIRFFAVSLSFCMILPADLSILPLCYFQSQCEDLYRALSSLLAHVIEVENEPNGRGLYNRHAMLALMKELRNPDRFMNQFKAQFASLTGTYTTLIKVHFWFGIITISILVDSQYTGQASLESILRDPLGVF